MGARSTGQGGRYADKARLSQLGGAPEAHELSDEAVEAAASTAPAGA